MSVIRETQDRSDPQQNYSLDPTKISIGAAGGLAETSGTIPEPPPIIQPGADEGNRKQRALEALESLRGIGSGVPQEPENLRTYNPPLPDEPLNIPEIGTQFVSNIGDAMGKGVVNPPLYNAQKSGSRFDNLLGIQRQRPPSENNEIFGPVLPISPDESKRIEVIDPITGSRTFKKVSNLFGKAPILGPFGGNFVSGFGGIINGTQQLTNQLLRGDLTAEEKVSESFKVIEQLSASWLQSLKVAESLGFDPDAIDRRAWGYKEFEDGVVFNPLGNNPVLRKALMKDPVGFVGNLAIASLENPLGAIATIGAGSEWGDSGPGAFGMLMYALTNITSLPISAVQDLHTLVKEGNPYGTLVNGKFLRSIQGRDYSFTAAQRVLPDGTVDNRLSLWAQQAEEPKTWEEWAQRNWLSSGIINSGDFIRKSLTGESGLDNPVSFFGIKPPKNMIGLSEFVTAMVLDGGVDFASGSALLKLQDVHASNKAFNSAIKGAPTPFDSLEVLQARQARNSKRIKQLQNRFVKNGGLNAKDTDELRNLNIMAQENQRLVDRVSDWGSPLEVPTDLTPRGVVKELARSDEVIQTTENLQRVTSAGGIDAKAPGQDIVPQKPVDGFVVNADGTINFAYDPKATPKPQGVTLTSVDTGFSTNQADDILTTLPDGTSVAKGPTNFDPATGMFKRNTGAVMEGVPPVGQAAVLPPRPNFDTLETATVNNPAASAKIERAKQHFIRLEADELEESTVIEPEVLGGEPRVVDIIPEEEDTIIEVAASSDGLIRGRVREKLLRQQRDLPGVSERAALPEVQEVVEAAPDLEQQLQRVNRIIDDPELFNALPEAEQAELRAIKAEIDEALGVAPEVEDIADTAAQQLQRVDRILNDPELFNALPEADQAELRAIKAELEGQRVEAPIEPEPLEPTIVSAQALPQREVIAQAVETAKRTTNIEDFVDDTGRIRVEEITQIIEDLSDSQINVMTTFNRARADLVNLKTQPIKGDEVIGVPTPASIKNIQDTARYLAVKEQIFNSYFARNSKEVSAAITRGERFITELQEKISVAEEALGNLDPASVAAGELLDRLATLEDLADDIQKNIDFLGAKSQTGQRGRLARLRAAYRKGKIPEPGQPKRTLPVSPENRREITRVKAIIDELDNQITRTTNPENIRQLEATKRVAQERLKELQTPVEAPVDVEQLQNIRAEVAEDVEQATARIIGGDVPPPPPPRDPGLTAPAPEPLDPTIAAADDLPTPQAEPLDDLDELDSEASTILETIASTENLEATTIIENLEHTQTELESVISSLQEAYVALPPASPQRKLLEAAIDETVGEHKKIQSQINRTRLGEVTSDGFERNIEFEYDPNDYRSAASPFNEAEDPAQVYVPWVEADGNIHRTPMSEFRQDNLGSAEVRPEMMDAYPFENVVGDLANQPDNYVENFYSHLVKKVTQMEAMYTEEAAKFQKLLSKVPTTSWKRKPIQKNLPQQATTTLPDQFADRVAKNKVINNADGLGNGVQPVYHGTRGRDIALTSNPIEVSASGPLGVGTYLTTDPENAVNYARSMGVPNRPNVDGTQFNANVGSVFRVTINSDRILDARKALPKAVKAELKNVLTDTTSAQFKTLLGNNAGGEQLAIALGKAIDNANNHRQLIDQIDIAIDVWARQALGTANLPEEVVLQTQRAVAITYRSFGIDAVQMTKKLKGYVDPITEIAVINPQVMRATAVQDMKVPSPVRQAAHRSNAEVITNKIYKTKRTRDAAIEAKMKLASQRSHETGKRYKKLTEQLDEVGSVRADRKIQQEIDRVDAFYKKFDADENLFGAANERIRARNASRTVPNQFKTQASFEDLPYKLNPDGSPKIDFKDFNEFLKKQKDKGIKISDEIEDRMRRLYTEYVTNQAATQTQQQAMAQKEKIIQGIVDTAFSQHITDMVNLNETSVGRFQQWMAMLFDYKWQALNPTVLSEAGKIRSTLSKASNVANGLIEQYARFQIAPLVDEFMKIGRAHLKPKVGHTLDFRRLMMDVLEIGAFEKLNAQARLMPGARALQKAKYDRLINELQQFIDEPVIESLLDFSRRISASADEVRMVANSAGLSLGRVNGIGYVERVLDPDVLRWWRATERKTKAKAFSKFVDDTAKRLDVNVQKSRGSFVFVPEDIDVLATLLRKDRDELMAMVDNNELYDYLRAQDPKVTQALEDFGILSKIHLSNREATEFLLEQFGDNLPELINKELFLTNPQDAFKQYANSLREQVQRSGVFKLLFGQGTKNGWIVPASVYDALPANAAEAKRIRDIGIPELFGEKAGKLSKDDFVELPASVIEKWAPAYKADGTVFVHKTVNNQINSMVNLFGHPESANVVFQAAYSLSRFWNEAMLLGKNFWYTANIALDSIKQAFAAGTDLMQFPKAMHAITRIILRNDLSGLDNTRKVFASFGGKLVTEKQMTLDFFQMWGKTLAPQQIKGIGTTKKTLVQLNPVRGARWYANFIQSFGPHEAGKSLLQDVRALQSSVFDKFGRAAAHAEMIARYAAYRTWMDRSPAKLNNKIGLTAKKFAHYYTAEEITDPNKAWRHMEDYFTNWDTVGTVPGLVGLFRPFLSYGLWNSPSQVRQFIKNPQGYRNQARMMYYMNQRLFAKEDMNEAAMPTWMSDSYYTGYDIEGNPMMLLPHGFDTRFDAITSLEKTEQQFLSDQKILSGSTKEKLEQMQREVDDVTLFGQLLGKSAITKTLVELATGETLTNVPIVDPTTGRGPLTGLPWRAEHLLLAYPPLKAIVKTNPGNILGRPEMRDSETGQVISPGVPGLIGGHIPVERGSNLDKYLRNPETATNFEKGMRLLARIGGPVRFIDRASNMRTTMRQMNRLLRETTKQKAELEAKYDKMLKEGRDKTSPKIFKETETKLRRMIWYRMNLQKDMTVMNLYFRANNLATDKDITVIDKLELENFVRENGSPIYEEFVEKSIDDLNLLIELMPEEFE